MPARTRSCGESAVMSWPSRRTLARAQRQHAEDRLHRGRLAGAVRADDDRDLALVDGDGAAVQDVGAAVAAGHRVADQEAHTRRPGFARRSGLFFRPRPR